MPTGTLNHNVPKHQSHVKDKEVSLRPSALSAVIIATLLIRIANRTSFVILGFYLGSHFASAAIVALVLETFYISELIVAPIVGSLSDRKGRKLFLVLCPLLAGISSCCLLLASRLFPHPQADVFNIKLALLLLMILVGRLLEGAASGMNVPATLGYLTDVTAGSTRLRSGIMTAFEVVTIGGMVLAIPFGGKLYSMLDTWGFLVVAALYMLVLAIILLWVMETTPLREARLKDGTLLEGLAVIRHKRIFSFLPAWFCVNALVGSWTTLMIIILSYPVPAADARHPGQLLYGGFSKLGASLWVGLFALVFLLGMGLWLFFLPRLRRTTVMLIGLSGLALTIIALTTINGLAENPFTLPTSERPTLYMLLALALLGVMLLSGFTPVALTQMSAIAETLPGKQGAVMGLYSVVLAIGQLLGAALGGVSVDLKGFYGLMEFSVLMGVFSLASVLYIRFCRDDLITVPTRDRALIHS